MTAEQERALKAVVMCVDFALGMYLAWIILPPSIKLPIELAIARELRKPGDARRRRSIERQMQFDTIMVAEAMASYDLHRDPQKFARDLATTH